MPASGSYISIASALIGADEGVKHVIKMGCLTSRPIDSVDPNELAISFITDHVLLDFKSAVARDLEVDKIIAGCDFVKQVAVKNTDKLKQLMEAYTSSPTGFEKASAIAEQIGFTEEAATAAGGGMAWAPVLVIVAIAQKRETRKASLIRPNRL
jgi:hypothetical protein